MLQRKVILNIFCSQTYNLRGYVDHSRYQQKFDLEGDTGIVVRGIGTAMTLIKLSTNPDKNLAPGSTMAATTMMGATNKDDPQQKT